jgi:release factor glutamine methyltransferase
MIETKRSDFIKSAFLEKLNPLYPGDEIRSILHRIVEARTGHPWMRFYTGTVIFTDLQMDAVMNDLKLLKEGTPIQYVTGRTEFCGFEFLTDPGALIPRPETEELVRWIVSEHQSQELNVLDLGTGTGCIAIALKKLIPGFKIMGVDISHDAISLATRNSQYLSANVKYLQADIFSEQFVKLVNNKFDLIVSNPPYIPLSEAGSIHVNVIDHEPHVALFVPDHDPLLFYRRICALAPELLKGEKRVYFETHSSNDLPMSSFTEQLNIGKCEFKKDISGKNRMLMLQF